MSEASAERFPLAIWSITAYKHAENLVCRENVVKVPKPVFFVNLGLLIVTLLVAEFALPNYASRFAMRLAKDIGLLPSTETEPVIPARKTLPETAILTNEFAFQVHPIDAETNRVAGVWGPDELGRFTVVDQQATEILGNDLGPFLSGLGWQYPDDLQGGIKQLFDIEGHAFGLFAIQDEQGCVFTAVIDVENQRVAHRFPCFQDEPGIWLGQVGGGYIVVGDTVLVGLGTGNGQTWRSANLAAQDNQSPYGKILQFRIGREGDAPVLTYEGIWASGLRNPQGFAKIGDHLLGVDHGPQGGDEINILRPDSNYGWPLFSVGSQYNEGDIPAFAPLGSEFDNPLFAFLPSEAVSDISPCPSVIRTSYRNADCALVSSLKGQSLLIVLGDFSAEQVWVVERVPLGVRVREVFLHNDELFIVPDFASVSRVEVTVIRCVGQRDPCGIEDADFTK